MATETPTICRKPWPVGKCSDPLSAGEHHCVLEPHDQDKEHICSCSVAWGGLYGEREPGEAIVTGVTYRREPIELRLRRGPHSLVMSMTHEESVLIRRALEAYERSAKCWCGGTLTEDQTCTTNVWHVPEDGEAAWATT